ncbi:MAG TPA: hypothetical protein DEB46_06930 [Myxococcales bacterium]|nr:hypothetical protein [Myxococcales bacterium]
MNKTTSHKAPHARLNWRLRLSKRAAETKCRSSSRTRLALSPVAARQSIDGLSHSPRRDNKDRLPTISRG